MPRASTDAAVKNADGLPAMPGGPVDGVSRVASYRISAIYPNVRIDITVALVRELPFFYGTFFSLPLW